MGGNALKINGEQITIRVDVDDFLSIERSIHTKLRIMFPNALF